jgi:hypothetical protein
VSVNAAGAVVDVTIDRRWSDQLEPAQLGDAIFDAYRQARRKRDLAQIIASRRRPAVAEPRAAAGKPDIDDPRWLGWLEEYVEAANRQLDELDRIAARRSTPASRGTGRDDAGARDVSGPRRFVRLRLSGGDVTGVVVDAPGYAVQAPDAVGQDAFAAFRSAARAEGDRRR